MPGKSKFTFAVAGALIILSAGAYFILFGRGYVREWIFESAFSGKIPLDAHHIGDFGWSPEEKALGGRAAGGDPFFIFGEDVHLDASSMPQFLLEIKIRIEDERPLGFAQLFWVREGETSFREEASSIFAIRNDGRFHCYRFDLSGNPEWRGVIKKIRLDPLNHQGRFALKRIRFGPKDMIYYGDRYFMRAAFHQKAAILFILAFAFFLLVKKFFALCCPGRSMDVRLRRIAASLPAASLLIYFCLLSFFPFGQYPGGRFRLLGADCLFPALFLFLGLLIQFLEKGEWRFLRILISGLFVFYVFGLGKSPGDGTLDHWRMAGLVLVVCLMVVSIWRETNGEFSLFYPVFILFIAAAFVSCAVHDGEPEGRYFLLNFYLPSLVIAALSRDAFKNRKKNDWFLQGTVVAGAIVAFYGVIEFFLGRLFLSSDFYWQYAEIYAGFGGVRRIGSTLVQPLVLTSYLLFILPVCGYCYKRAGSPLGKIGAGFAFFISLTAFILAKSRTGWVLGVIVLFLAFGQFRKRHIYVVLIILVMVLLAEFFLFFYGEQGAGQPVTKQVPYDSPEAEAFRKGEIQEIQHVSGGDRTGGLHFMTQRLAGIKVVFSIFREYPWLGVGPGHYKKYCQSLRENRSLSGYRDTPDNMILMLAAETGFIGISLFLMMMILLLIGLAGKLKTGGEDLGGTKVVIAGMAGLLLHMLFYDMLYWSVSSCCFWMLVGFGGSLVMQENSRMAGS